MYSRTASDSLKLRRLITSLKETGSDLAGQLEDQSTSFFTGVQVVRSNNANRVRFDSDEEDNDVLLACPHAGFSGRNPLV